MRFMVLGSGTIDSMAVWNAVEVLGKHRVCLSVPSLLPLWGNTRSIQRT